MDRPPPDTVLLIRVLGRNHLLHAPPWRNLKDHGGRLRTVPMVDYLRAAPDDVAESRIADSSAFAMSA
jgi:hypothetical protein